MSADLLHVDVAAYALGLLEEPDRRAFEAHLPSCLPCHEELAVLRGVAATLDGMAPIDGPADAPSPAPDPAAVSDLLRRRARGGRGRRRARVLAAAAATAVLLGGAAGAGFALGADRREAPPPVAGAELDALFRNGRSVAASDPGTGVAGTVAMEGRGWGSRVGLRLSKVRGPLECELVAIDRRGRGHTVAGWSVPAKGYGRPGSPAPLALQGGTAVAPGDIARFEVRTLGDDRTLLTVPT